MKSSLRENRMELFALVSIIVLLGANDLLAVLLGSVSPVFFLSAFLSAALAFLFPRAGLFSSIALTVFFERFHALVPVVIGDVEYKLYALDVVLAASLVVAALRFFRRGQFPFVRKSEGILLLFFAVVTTMFLVGLFGFSESNLSTAFSTWKNYVFYGATALLVVSVIRTKGDLISLMKVFLSSVAVATIFLVIGIVRGEGLWTEYTPLSTTGVRLLAFPHAFYFALAFLTLIFSAPLWFSDMKRRRWIAVLCLVLGIGILGSLMRHLWLGIAGTIAFGFVLFPSVYRRLWLRMAIPALGLFGFSALVFLSGLSLFPQSDVNRDVSAVSEVVFERMFSIGNRYDESLAWRGEVWRGALDRFSESPLFGIGFGASVPVELGGYESFVEVRNMHNSWLALLIQTGVVGAILFLAFLSTVFRNLFRSRYRDRFLDSVKYALLGLIVFQCLVFFSQPYLETNLLGMFFWVTIGAAQALIRMDPDPRKRDPS